MRLVFWVALSLALACPVVAGPAWTVALFLNANNDLDQFLDGDLVELTQAAANANLKIVAQVARRGQPARRVVFEPAGPRTLAELGTVDMGDPKSLTDFFRWAAANAPADHVALVLWDHGSGWEKTAGRAISHDEVSGHRISTEQLGKALAECRDVLGRKLDIVAMDACLMQMVEVLYCIGGTCDFVVASEEAVPGTGYPYFDALGGVAADTTAEALATRWAQSFIDWYKKAFGGTRKRATQSAVRTSALADVFAACDAFSAAMLAGGHAREVAPCLETVVKYLTFGRTNVDLGQLAELVAKSTADAGLRDACARVQAALAGAVLVSGSAGDPDLEHSHGISIYFPRKPSSYDSAYGSIPFCRAHAWGRMVWLYFKELGLVWALDDTVQ